MIIIIIHIYIQIDHYIKTRTLLRFGDLSTAVYWVLVIAIVLMAVAETTSVILLHNIIGMPIWKYIYKVFLSVSLVTFLSFIPLFFIHRNLPIGFFRLCVVTIVGVVIVLVLAYLIGIDKRERTFVNDYLKKLFKKHE